MKCSKSNVMQCSFPEWYKAFEDVTIKSAVIPLPASFIEYLHTDGLVLPESASHGIYTKSEHTAMDGDDDDPDLRDEDLMNMYEDDWSTPDNIEDAKVPEFSLFENEVKAAIKSLGGRVFPKLNWSSPKDANWISFDKSLLCTCPSDVFLLLKSSEFVTHDIDQPFVHCEEDDSINTPDINYCLVLRKWQPPDPSTEFRCFVYKNKLIGACQRQATKYYSHLLREKESIIQDIEKFYKNKISEKFTDSSYIFDVVRPKKGKVTVIDFNPFGQVTDTILFTWEEIEKLTSEQKSSHESFDFRCVESEDGVKCSEYANYAMPQDIQDLAAGEDPYKLMDLMKLKCNLGHSSDDESDKEDHKSS